MLSVVFWNQKKYAVRENKLIPRKTKKTMHSLRNANHIKIDLYMPPEIWFPNLR